MNNKIAKSFIFVLVLSATLGLNGQNLMLKAKSGSAEAQYELATQYYKGIGQLQNYSSAFAWYKKAAEQNHLASCHALATMYEQGLGCTQNERLAFSYYMQAAERGHFASQLRVAQMLDEGIGVVDNPARAYLWYRICADRDEVYACRRIGDYYLDGIVVERDLIEAKHWYEKAAEQNDLDAMQKLAYIYVVGESVAPNYEKASKLSEEPLKKDMAVAQYVKAFLCENGFYERKQPKVAEQYYIKSAEQGFEPAKELLKLKTIKRGKTNYILGTEYINGTLVKKNVKKGLNYLTAAASQGSSEAYLALGKLYKEGKQVKRNNRKAQNYFKDAAALGNKEAEQYLQSNK